MGTIEEGSPPWKVGSPFDAPDTISRDLDTAHITMSTQDFTENTPGDSAPDRTGNDDIVSPTDLVASQSGATEPTHSALPTDASANGHTPFAGELDAGAEQELEVEGAPEPTPSFEEALSDPLAGDLVLGPPTAPNVPSAPISFPAYPVAVPFKAFDWKHEDVDIYHYLAWWEDMLLFEVGYLNTPQGVLTSERRSVDGKRNYIGSMQGIKRPLFGVRSVATSRRIIFTENEPSAQQLNRCLGSMGLGKEMTATTTSAGHGNASKTTFTQYFRGREVLLEGKEVVVIVGNHPAGGDHADDICRICAPVAAWVKRIELPILSPGQTHDDVLQSLENVGDLLDLIEDAPIWADNPSAP